MSQSGSKITYFTKHKPIVIQSEILVAFGDLFAWHVLARTLLLSNDTFLLLFPICMCISIIIISIKKKQKEIKHATTFIQHIYVVSANLKDLNYQH